MTQALLIHKDNPQLRLLRIATEALHAGKIIIYPTDSNYALGCQVGNKHALERICILRGLEKDHKFTLMCRDLSDVSRYAKVSNTAFRIMKAHIPGPYTFILPASGELPKRLQENKRKTIGVYVPACKITQALLAEFGEPLLTTSCIFQYDAAPLCDPHDIYMRCKGRVDFILDSGIADALPTTVVDLTVDPPVVLRRGKGPFGG